MKFFCGGWFAGVGGLLSRSSPGGRRAENRKEIQTGSAAGTRRAACAIAGKPGRGGLRRLRPYAGSTVTQ